MSCHIAVLGATGLVGRTILELVHRRGFPADRVTALASSRSAGGRVAFGDGTLPVLEAKPDVFEGVDLVLSSAGASVSRVLLHEAVARGAVCIDNTSAFRMDPDVPLVVPEVNGHRLERPPPRGIIANPNCSTIQLVMVLAPLIQAFGVERVRVATYQSVSGAGQDAVDGLIDALAGYAVDRNAHARAESPSTAFHAVPQIDTFEADADGPFEGGAETREEWKLRVETAKILGMPLPLHATCVRVPVVATHAEAVWLETEDAASPDQVRSVLQTMPGVEVLDAPSRGAYPTAALAAGREPVYVGRVRRDPTHPRGLSLWIVADNILKGAALNAVQIAERLVDGDGSGASPTSRFATGRS